MEGPQAPPGWGVGPGDEANAKLEASHVSRPYPAHTRRRGLKRPMKLQIGVHWNNAKARTSTHTAQSDVITFIIHTVILH